MKIKVDYFDNVIEITKEQVNTIEIENKPYFYRFVKDLISISNGNISEEIHFINENNEESSSPNIRIYTDYFSFDFDTKKYTNDITKYLLKNIDENDQKELIQRQKDFVKSLTKTISKMEIPLELNEDEQTCDNILKKTKIKIKKDENLLENLFLIIDLEKELASYNALFFINLKQYLSSQELEELYKYSIYNEIKIFLIDSQSYGTTKRYEKKLIVDENLDEFMV